MSRRRSRFLLLVLGLLALLAWAGPAQAVSTNALRAKLTREMRLAGSSAGLYVVDIDADRPLFSLRPDRPLMPASVNKVFVTAAALRRFGPDAQLQTELLTAGQIDEAGVLDGDLYLRGGGDPTLTGPRVVRMAESLGLTEITGDLVADESRFDRLRGSYRTSGRIDSDIGGQIGALVIARGWLGRGYQPSPPRFAARQVLETLEKQDVRIGGRLRLGRTPEDAVRLAVTESAPMLDLLARTNVPSDNYLAEALLKQLGAEFGAEGTTLAGARIVRAEMTELGAPVQVVDGSGLSRSDRATPRQVVRVFEQMAEGEHGEMFLRTFPVPGRSGTVLRRMRGTPAAGRCRTKTGTLRDVSNLAGICTTASGDRVAFAILMNDVNVYGARAIQDRIAATIAGWSGG